MNDNREMGDATPDAVLVEAVREGDAAAFEALVRRYIATAHRVAMSIVKDSDEADDICQDAFLSALSKIEKLREPARFRSWFLTIVKNRSLNALSSNARRAELPLGGDPEEGHGEGPDQALQQKELDEAVHDALQELSVTQKKVFVLHDLEGRDHRDVADRLGISTGSSRVHLHMARRALRSKLDRIHLEEA